MNLQSIQRLGRRLLLGDLSRSLRSWEQRYSGDYYKFYSDEVICMLNRLPGNSNEFEVVAGCGSNDPKLNGFYWFYRDGPYSYKEEANFALTRSVAKAARTHPRTRFLFSAGSAMNSQQEWKNGEWQGTSTLPSLMRCAGCTRPLVDSALFCRNCGEPNLP